MNIYLISQEVNNDFDTFDAFVVYAENEQEASSIGIEGKDTPYLNYLNSSWVSDPKDVKVEFLGIAKDNVKSGKILGSFNAG